MHLVNQHLIQTFIKIKLCFLSFLIMYVFIAYIYRYGFYGNLIDSFHIMSFNKIIFVLIAKILINKCPSSCAAYGQNYHCYPQN